MVAPNLEEEYAKLSKKVGLPLDRLKLGIPLGYLRFFLLGFKRTTVKGYFKFFLLGLRGLQLKDIYSEGFKAHPRKPSE